MRRVMLTEGDARQGRRRVFALLTAVLAAAALVASGIALALPGHDGATSTASGRRHPAEFASAQVTAPARAHAAKPVQVPQAVVRISDASTTPVPPSYFGLSTEYGTLPLFERNMPVFERVLSLLHVPGNGPLVLRIGGDSADHSFWMPKKTTRRMPAWAIAVTPGFVAQLRSLVKRDPVKLIVDLNLVTDTPLTAATWARAAETSLPRGSIVGFEVGNEPDLYTRSYWLATVARSPLETRPLPLELTPDSYVERLLCLRARARRRRARRAADRAGGGAPQAQPEVDLDPDRRRAPRARGSERAPVSVLRMRQAQVATRAIRPSRACSAGRPWGRWPRTSPAPSRSRTTPA